jgi:hypothetical protein
MNDPQRRRGDQRGISQWVILQDPSFVGSGSYDFPDVALALNETTL